MQRKGEKEEIILIALPGEFVLFLLILVSYDFA